MPCAEIVNNVGFPEIISHIFTIGSDNESFYADYSLPRHIKPYINIVSQVCRRWNAITRWKTNAHFWVTNFGLHLLSSIEGDDISQHNHRVHTVTRFRHALRSAGDSDVTLFWRSNLSAIDS